MIWEIIGVILTVSLLFSFWILAVLLKDCRDNPLSTTVLAILMLGSVDAVVNATKSFFTGHQYDENGEIISAERITEADKKK